MKKLIALTLAVALVSPVAFAQNAKKKAAEAAPAEKKPAAEAPAKADKPLPMNSRVDELDAASKSWTQVNKDGKRVKHVVTDETTIMLGEAPAKFEDIKVGDTVAGLRKKVSDTEYTVVKITKFGHKAPKAEKSAEEKKPAAKKEEKKP
jgi:hypothetical protein